MFRIPPSFLSRIVAFIFLLFGLPALFAPKNSINTIQRSLKNDETVMLGGFIILILALLFFMEHYGLRGIWSIIFLILGWLSVIKGVIMIRYPKLSAMGGKAVYGKRWPTMLVGLFLILLTIIFLWSTVIRW